MNTRRAAINCRVSTQNQGTGCQLVNVQTARTRTHAKWRLGKGKRDVSRATAALRRCVALGDGGPGRREMLPRALWTLVRGAYDRDLSCC